MNPSEFRLIDFWQAAFASPVGVAITTEAEDRKLLREQLYRARAELGDPKLEAVVLSLPKIEGEIWLVRRDAADAKD